MKLKNAPANINYRRENALSYLEAQLKSGVKPSKENPGADIPLTDSDKKRIEKEINTLKSKITSPEVAVMRKNKKYRGPK